MFTLFFFSGAFVPYVEHCKNQVMILTDYDHEDIRRAALMALTKFTICIGKQPGGEQGNTFSTKQNVSND